ncbi:MAG: dimethylamine:corrinoid methyltransferase [Candidatus Aminicenantes bacterium]|nr:dimethylamine:corrinoid methyltransferase [Candidatus Aminicenantes bacterium]
MSKIKTRMGDAALVEITESELRSDLEEGTKDAAQRGKIPPLSPDELNHLFDIYSSPARVVGVEPGHEVVFTYDSTCGEINRTLIPVNRLQSLQMFERLLGADTIELGHNDYSFKAVKPVISDERTVVEQAVLATTVPLFYGAMPNLGLYNQPEGPVPNSSKLMSEGKIKEARESMEAAVEFAVRDMVYVAGELYESGVDGIDFDTTGSAGDADFLATLRAVEILKKKYPDLSIEMGMSGEFVLGMHGGVAYDGTRLAGLYPHQQVKLAEKAGVTIFGPVVNTNTSRTCAWNAARVITFLKACVEASTIPVHANMGMGVGGLPVTPFVPIDAVSRASKSVVELTRLDGL